MSSLILLEGQLGQFKPGRQKTGGRKPGSVNRDTRRFKEIVDGILLDDPSITRQRLLELRDSDEEWKVRLFWQLCARRLPVAIEAKVEEINTVDVVVRKYSSGRGKLPNEQKLISTGVTNETE